MSENTCVDWCVRRVSFGEKDLHLHAPTHGRNFNVYGPNDDPRNGYLTRRSFKTRGEADAAFDELERELLAVAHG